MTCQVDGFVYPEKRNLDTLRADSTIWKQFIQKLGSIPFYEKMSKSEREVWLYVNEESTHNSNVIGDNNYIQILQPGGISGKLTDKQINTIMKGNRERKGGLWTGPEFEAYFPKKPGSNAIKHTLVLIRSFWRINNTYKIVNKYSGNTIQIPFDSKTKLNKRTCYVLKDINFISKDSKNSKKPTISEVAVCTYPESSFTVSQIKKNKKIREKLKKAFGNLPPSFYKSFIQKIIRFRPKTIKFPKYMKLNDMESDVVLESSVLILAEQSGSFVPDIQRYVTGKEACFKRLAVSIVEDGYSRRNDVATLFTSALLAQRVKSWHPHEKIYKLCVEMALKALNSNKYFNYSIKNGSKIKPIYLTTNQSAMERSSAVMDELRSFSTDIDMLRDSANCKVVSGKDTRPEFMYVEHAVDHHWATGVAYYMDTKLVNSICKSNNSKTFAPLFKLLWDISSGFNVRKKDYEEKFNDDKIIKKIRKAQHLYLVGYQAPKKIRKTLKNKKYEIKVNLNDGWLASLIGTLDVGLRPPSLVTVNPENITEFIAIRRPSRDRNEILTDDQKKRAIEKAKTILKGGVCLKYASSPISELKGAKAFLEEKDGKIIWKIMCKGSKKLVKWDKIKSNKQSFPIHKKIDGKMRNILVNIGKGVEKDHKKSFKSLIHDTSEKVLRRVIYYLSGYNSEINVNRIGREGGGIVQSVTVEDVGAFQFLLKSSKIYCGALEPKLGSECGFYVRSILLVEEMKDFIIKFMSDNKNKFNKDNKDNKDNKNKEKWKNITDKKSRKLWDHQKQIIKELAKNSKSGIRGAFIWLRVGMGKTLIVMKHIQHLIKIGKMPKYIIYTLPDSSLNSIVEEVKMFGLTTNVIIPRENEILKPYSVNLVTSDNKLRICEKILIKHADESLFIVDEVHKAMNDTQRTTVASNIASLSKDFIVMTGTPVIDSKTYKLISWLKMIVPYEVNDKNYLVAANSMLTRNVKTGVKVLRTNIEAPFINREEEKYLKLVPLALGGKNTNHTHHHLRLATEICYDMCDIEMVKQVNLQLKLGKRVMLVTKDIKHQMKMNNGLMKSGIKKKDIYLLEAGKSLVLTDESVKKTGIDYKVVIVPIRRAEGYTLTRMNVMICSVYPSNQATRTQIEGRINRIGQKSKEVEYITVHAGILTNIMNNHNDAKSLELALMKMAKK